MRCDELIKKIEESYPLSCAEEWDNPGLLVGHRMQEVHKILVALDATEETIGQAVRGGADLLITHHPLLFKGVRSISDETFLGRRLLALIENGIACYAMHTNFDVLGMSLLNAAQMELVNPQVLSVTSEEDGVVEGFGRIGEWEVPRTLREAAAFVREKLQIEDVRCYGLTEEKEEEEPRYCRVAICGGSGKSMIKAAVEEGAQILVTGDIDYHSALDALAQGLHILDAGHYGTEFGFVSYMAAKLRRYFPELEIEEASDVPPYRVVTKER